jgi:beta-N-acetylhexosaminidase
MRFKTSKIYISLIFFSIITIITRCNIVKDKLIDNPNNDITENNHSQPPVQQNPEEDMKNIISKMSIEEKVGQMFIVRCPVEKAVENITEYNLGGYILFARDFEGKTKQQLADKIQSYQDVSEIKMLIAVDEEGGTVNRLSILRAFRAVPFWSPQKLYREGGWELVISDTVEKSALLKSLGINVNMAPVCDISENPEDYIYSRTFGKNAAETSRYVETVVKTMKSESIGSVLKHFPGYGNNKDTHTGIVHDKRSYENFANNDFKPFKAGVDAGAGAVLVSHNIVEAVDDEYPASLSPKMHKLLRSEFNFNGVIMTDDLVMDAIKDYTGESEAAVAAVLAGNDLLCCTNFETQIPAVIDAVNNGIISETQIDGSVLRILKWKDDIGILN